ncbi:hypothetical protein ACLOJK_012659 [Asimina triloba]
MTESYCPGDGISTDRYVQHFMTNFLQNVFRRDLILTHSRSPLPPNTLFLFWLDRFPKRAQLGLGDVIDRNIPCEVALENHMPTNIACGWWHTLALAESPT